MKRQLFLIGLLAVLLGIALTASLSRAQGPDTPTPTPGGEVVVEGVGPMAAVGAKIPIQGRLTDRSGNPVADGNYNITASIYNVSSGGTALCSDADTVSVSNGLFTMNINHCDSDDINGRQLYLGIKVGTDAEMTPRQAIYPVPYAWSLRPGAVISNTTTTGHALEVWSAAGSGATGTALWVRNTNTGSGIALWARAQGTDTTLISSAEGSGPIFKGFGGDGGEHEFIIYNDGSVWAEGDVSQSRTADGLVKAGVFLNCAGSLSEIDYSFNNVGGTIALVSDPDGGQCTIDFNFDISDRYFVATALTIDAARGVTCSRGGALPNDQLHCFRWKADGSPVGGDIMVLVY